MHRYFIKTPWIVRKLYGDYVWRVPVREPVVYLTFDDGPHPEVTPWVLAQLRTYGAKATFFCVGSNVARYPEVYRSILAEGHAVGNHTQHHRNGWQTGTAHYLQDVAAAAALIDSALFRPPYGRIRRAQARGLTQAMGKEAKVVMWDVLSADFDAGFRPHQCLDHVVRKVGPGSIVVFHDSEKAWGNLQVALPGSLENLQGRGYRFGRLDVGGL